MLASEARTADPPQRAAYQPLIVVLAALCGGIVLDRHLPVSAVATLVTSLVCLLAWLLLWRRRGQDRWASPALLVALAMLGAAWHHTQWNLFSVHDLGTFAQGSDQPACVRARVASGPRRVPAPGFDPMRTMPMGDRTRLDLTVFEIRDDATWRRAGGTVTLIVDGHLLGVRAGDRVQVFGELAAIAPATNPGEFDFAQHVRGDRQLCSLRTAFPECVTLEHHGRRWNAAALVDQLRASSDRLLSTYVEKPRAGLAAAMFLGLREQLDTEQSQAFLETGTVHLLVVSGLNVGILAGCIALAARAGLIPYRFAMGAGVAATFLYALVTDWQPPVVRAMFMAVALTGALALSRRASSLNSLAAAGIFVLAYSPCELFRAGTQLSFLSVIALIWASRLRIEPSTDPLARLIAAARPWPVRLMRRGCFSYLRLTVISLVIWSVVAPLVMARFHLLSPVAVVLGPLLVVPVAVAMASGFGVMLLSWLAPPLGQLSGWLCDASLSMLQTCVSAGQRLPGNHLWVSGPADWWLAGFYGLLAAWMFVPRLRLTWQRSAAIVAAWSGIGLSVAWVQARSDQALHCAFLSVGHGCAVVLELPGGQTVLYDGGRMGSPNAAGRAISSYLWSRGITRLDAVVVSHADADHYNALPQVAERFPIGVVYVSPVMFEEPGAALTALKHDLDRRRVPIRTVWGGDRLRTAPGCELEVLHPPRRGVLGSDNANSIVLAASCQGRRILLTGDLESPGLDDVLAETPLDCDVLLAPHHGSAFSDPPGLARWSTPEWVVVSGSVRDVSPEVMTAYTARGSRVLHTARNGAVQVSVDHRGLRVSGWRVH